MPAPTALKAPTAAEPAPPGADIALPVEGEDDVLLDSAAMNSLETSALQPPAASDSNGMEIDEESRPQFAPQKDAPLAHRTETRKVPIPPHRMTPLKG
jgi:RNA-binding protein PNO1